MAGTAVDVDRVVAGTANGPALFVAPEGSTAPTDADSALDAAFVTPGYLSEEGPAPSFDPTFTDVTAYQSVFPIKRIPGAATLTVAFTMKEVSPESVGLFFGLAAPTETLGEFTLTGQALSNPPVQSVVLQANDGTSYVRLYIARAQLSAAGAITWNRADALSFPATLAMLDNGVEAPYSLFSKQAA